MWIRAEVSQDGDEVVGIRPQADWSVHGPSTGGRLLAAIAETY